MPRRKLETAIGKLFIPTLVGLALGTIPYVPYYLEKHYVTQGTITGLFGLAAGVLAATVGAILYLYATLVFACFLIVLLSMQEHLHPALTLMRLP
jgi:hypothetical protein